MERKCIAVGLDSLGAVRLDVRWTPGKEGVAVDVRNSETLVSYGMWEAPRLAIMPYVPDSGTLHSAVRCMLGAVQKPSLWVSYALGVAGRNGFTWHPERLV